MLVESNVVIIFYMVFDPDIFLACFTCFTLYSEMSHSRSLSRHGPQVTGRLDLSHLPEQAVHPEGLRPPGDLPGLGQELGDEALLTEIPGGAGQAILEVSPVCGEVMCEAEERVGAPAVSLHQALHTHHSPAWLAVFSQSGDNTDGYLASTDRFLPEKPVPSTSV